MLRRGLFEADPKSALPLADEIVACGKQDGVQLYPAWARFYQGVVAAQDADPRPGIAIMRQVRQALRESKVRLFGPIHLYHLAAAHRRCGDYDAASELLEEGIRIIETTGERMFEAELYRLLGELELEVGRVESGEAALRTATAVARRQQARLWNCVPPLPWRATGARTETRRRRGICSLRFMAGFRKGWTLPICSERDPCWSGSIEIAPPHASDERPVSLARAARRPIVRSGEEARMGITP